MKNRLGEKFIHAQSFPLGNTIIRVDAVNLLEVIKTILEENEDTAISAITGVDQGNSIELLYHLRVLGKIYTIRLTVPKDIAIIQSITPLIPGANLHEREVMDLFGVKFEGHPNPERFVIPEGWPSGIFPLRKDVDISNIKIQTSSEEPQVEGKLVNIIIGPQHPALLEPEKFSIQVDGEIVTDVKPRLGYVHRGIEKASEKRTYLQDIYLVERICGICNACHASCFCQAVEALLGITVPQRARYLRTIILELNRIHSHMLLLGHTGFEIGYESFFQYMWRDREPIMDMMELLTGNRVIASFITIGGVRRDIKDSIIPRIKSDLETLEKRLPFYKDLFENDTVLKMRLKGVGILDKQDAVKLSVVGPVARGSGIGIDIRKNDPYAAYEEIPFNVVTFPQGDSWARLMTRLIEIGESINIIKFVLDHLPGGSYRLKVPRVVPPGEAISHVEAPRGELFYYVKSNGTAYPERVKVRTPTLSNILSFVHIAKGGNIADVPASFSSLDPCFSCTDR